MQIINTALSGGPKEAVEMVKRRSRTDSSVRILYFTYFKYVR